MTTKALQVFKIENNGYFEEPLGEVKILDHYHNFLFFINTTKFSIGYSTLVENYSTLKQDTIKFPVINKLRLELLVNLKMIKEKLDKLGYPTSVEEELGNFNDTRPKRGIANGLGTVIKFITGNLDDNDLKALNENIGKLHTSQNKEIERVNKLISFANQITDRLTKETKILNTDLDMTKNAIRTLAKARNYQNLLQSEIYQSQKLLDMLLTIERSISMSFGEMANLELIKKNELDDIKNFLQTIYTPQQLLPTDEGRPFKLLEATKFSLVGTSQTITFLLKIPIIKPYPASYFQFYPIPNTKDLLIVPPEKFIIRLEGTELWTSEACKLVSTAIICMETPVQNNCTTLTLELCNTMKATNNYELIHLLRNNQLLAAFKKKMEIIEDCHGVLTRQEIQEASLISSPCRIILGSSIYTNTTPTYEIPIPIISSPKLQDSAIETEFHLRHLRFPEELKHVVPESRGNLWQNSHTLHYTNTAFSIICLLIIIAAALLYWKHRGRIHDVVCKPRTIIHLQSSPDARLIEMTSLNEDVQS